MNEKVATLYEWIGGGEVLKRLLERFYEKVPLDPLLSPFLQQCQRNISSTWLNSLAKFLGGRLIIHCGGAVIRP